MRLNLILNNISAPSTLIPLIPALFLVAGPAIAQENSQELSRRIDQLARQVEDLRIGEVPSATAGKTVSGLGPAASKVYQASQGVSVGGYGEMLFTGKSGADDTIDFYRAITYIGYRFDENWVFNSEIEIEHVTDPAVEFAYLDWLGSARRVRQICARVGIETAAVCGPNATLSIADPAHQISKRRIEFASDLEVSVFMVKGPGRLEHKTTDEDLDRVPAEGDWPIRRVLEHILEAEESYGKRIEEAVQA